MLALILRLNVKLSLGAVTQEVVVESSQAQVETVSNGIGQVIDSTQVVELPLNGRDPDQLIALAGATTTAVGGDLNSNKNFPTITIAVAGGLPNGVAFILDGATHNEPTNNLNMPQPSPMLCRSSRSRPALCLRSMAITQPLLSMRSPRAARTNFTAMRMSSSAITR